MIAWTFCEASEGCVAVSTGTGFYEGPLSLVAYACLCVSGASASCFPILEPLYTDRNEELDEPRRICSGLASIGVKLGLLLVDHMLRLSMVLSAFFSNVESV